ncbi:A/G-specific adenine glycosylase [Marinilactibacillus kalidii]|uniref:A/G-specific adenine glycosylase n=1 Tax=Marinilactibacillus kalidii TaxID=2820274 RepID=UPI001ABE9F46|nr:A/G-specific adenine glycosylase [Marinilactibacillus kalidii]
MKNKSLSVAELKEKYQIEMWPQEKIEQFRTVLLDWYDEEKRDLPWRRTSDPYKIWISEIMLQQTRVDTVIPYYNRFLEIFPTIADLAKADEDTLLKAWEGLGYYSRVRNMKAAAIQVMTTYDGKFPTEFEEIKKLKGIGPYTAGAVSSIAFNQAEPAVDGNLMRVLSRLFEIDVDIAKPASRKVFEEVMYHIIDQERPGDFNQALMDLGATICTPKNYDPSKSPVKDFNASYLNETYLKYPFKSKKKKSKIVNYFALLIKDQSGRYLLEKRSEDKLLANMWTFPMIEEQVVLDQSGWKSFVQKDLHEVDEAEAEMINRVVKDKYSLGVKIDRTSSGTVKHVFTHLHWNIYLYEAELDQATSDIPTNCEWVAEDAFDQYVFPVLQQKLLKAHKEITLF